MLISNFLLFICVRDGYITILPKHKYRQLKLQSKKLTERKFIEQKIQNGKNTEGENTEN